MKLVKQYETHRGVEGLKNWEYDYNDSELFVRNFKSISTGLALRLCNYLKNENKIVNVNECYDAQSGWRGTHFIINNDDLSANGYCFSSHSLDTFLKNNKY